tara:strand:- start:687 stop:3821 length:3135 start_codon:yes stop_codon:yes gene_type:complete
MEGKYDEGALNEVLLSKIQTYKNVVKNTYIAVEEFTFNELITTSELLLIKNELSDIIVNINSIEGLLHNVTINYDYVIEQLQEINNKLSSIIKQNGTRYLEDMIIICYGDEFIHNNIKNNSDIYERYKLLNDGSSVMNYKIVSWNLQNRKDKVKKKNNILEDIYISEISNTMDIHNINNDVTNFNLKIYGCRVVVQNESLQQTIIINCLLNNIPYKFLSTNIFNNKLLDIRNNSPSIPEYEYDMYNTFLESLTTKDLLVYTNEDIHDLFKGYQTNINMIKSKLLSKLTREFINDSLYDQRLVLIQLLLNNNDNESQYIAYLLYDILSTNSKNEGDNHTQTKLYATLPSVIQINFKNAMKNTIEYTSKLLDIDLESKLPLEQRICLLKTSDSVKEKAMLKVKELRAKNEDTGSKARHYIEGLLKIPFGIYIKEYVLNILDNISNKILNSSDEVKKDICIGKNFNKFQLINACRQIKPEEEFNIKKINKIMLNEIVSEYKNLYNESISNSKGIKQIRDDITKKMLDDTIHSRIISIYGDKTCSDKTEIYNDFKEIKKYIEDVHVTLDKAVHGHEHAKKQIERIIGQWITGEQSGYCFGFEGPPGVGKTSLAKNGISKCLKDSDGNVRPFGFIAIGGSSNGSTLDGHNYTYVGSMWGKIVDIIIESKCMNPIIFIDEIDKVSRTETGREIIGILTHLVDPTQNDKFQDKYFSGIDLDLSKVLFIFSYNDVELMDSILLDRIHRVKFKHLSIDEKITITLKYILPEYATKMGYNKYTDIIEMDEDLIKYIIDNYTAEAGVRKLKEILFEIVSEINLELLSDSDMNIPIRLTEDLIKFKYLKKRHPMIPKLIHEVPKCGIINGLWANALGKGGIIQIETQFMLSSNMLEMKLTGMQGDVMKESMSVAKSLAWKLTPSSRKERLFKIFDGEKSQGIHIHCPEGAVPKDGPSAGTAITTCVYSLLNDIPIRNNLAITGEMNLQGNVTIIGGLDLKILGGITAGVKVFLFPKENLRDFEDFMEEWGDKDIVKGIEFYPIETIEDALEHALVK